MKLSILNPYMYTDIVLGIAFWKEIVLDDMMRVLQYIKNNHDIRISSMQSVCDMSSEEIIRNLKKLIEVGVIIKPQEEEGEHPLQDIVYELAISTEDVEDVMSDVESYYELRQYSKGDDE